MNWIAETLRLKFLEDQIIMLEHGLIREQVSAFSIHRASKFMTLAQEQGKRHPALVKPVREIDCRFAYSGGRWIYFGGEFYLRNKIDRSQL